MKKNSKLNKILTTLGGVAVSSAAVIPIAACGEIELSNEEEIWKVLGNETLVSDEEIIKDLNIAKIDKASLPSVLETRLIPSEIVSDLKAYLVPLKELGNDILADFSEKNVTVQTDDEEGTFQITFSIIEGKSRTLKIANFLTKNTRKSFSDLFNNLNQISSITFGNNLPIKPNKQKTPQEVVPSKKDVIRILKTILNDDLLSPYLDDERIEFNIKAINETGQIVVQLLFGEAQKVNWEINGFKSADDLDELYNSLNSVTAADFANQMSIPDEDLNELPSQAIEGSLNADEIASRMRSQLTILINSPDVASYLTGSLLDLKADNTTGTITITVTIPGHDPTNFTLENFSTASEQTKQALANTLNSVTNKEVQEILELTPDINTAASVAAKTLSETDVKTKLQRLSKITNEEERKIILATKIEIIAINSNGQIQIKIDFQDSNIDDKSFYIDGYQNYDVLVAIHAALIALSNEEFNYEFEIPQELKRELPQNVIKNYLTKSSIRDKISALSGLSTLSQKVRFSLLEEYLEVSGDDDTGIITISATIPGFEPITWTISGFAQTNSSQLQDRFQNLLADDNYIPTNKVIEAIWPPDKTKEAMPSSYLLPDSEDKVFMTKEYVVNQIQELAVVTAMPPEEKNTLTPDTVTITANDGSGTIIVAVNVTGGRLPDKQYIFTGFKTPEEANLSAAKSELYKLSDADFANIYSAYTSTTATNPTKATINYVLNKVSISTQVQKILRNNSTLNDESIALFNDTAFQFNQIDNTNLAITIHLDDESRTFNVSGFLDPANTSENLKKVLNEVSQTELFNALGFDLSNYGKQVNLTPYNLNVLTAGNIRWAWFYADNGDQVEQLKRLGQAAFRAFYAVDNIEKYFFISHGKILSHSPNNEIEITFRIKIYDPLYPPPDNENATENLLYDHEFNTKDYWKS